MKNRILFVLLATCCIFQTPAQENPIQIRRKALDIGIYDYSKAKKNVYKIYYKSEADLKFEKELMQSDRLKDSGIFGDYSTQEDGSVIFFREEHAYEYCPELNYVMITGGHGFVSAYDLASLEEIFVNPSTYIYSPSRKYRFGTFKYDGVKYYIEYKKGDNYISHLITYASEGEMSGVYWVDDDTIHFLTEKRRADATKYHIGYSMQFIIE